MGETTLVTIPWILPLPFIVRRKYTVGMPRTVQILFLLVGQRRKPDIQRIISGVCDGVTSEWMCSRGVFRQRKRHNCGKWRHYHDSSTGASAFPEFNGTFTFDVDQTPLGIPAGTAFRYERRTGNDLQNVTLADARRTWINFTVDNGTRLVLDKFLIVHSTGTVGGATRHVTYHVPLGMMSGGVFRKVEDLDKNMEHFFTDADKSIGTHTSSGGKMAVTDVVDPYAIRSGGLLYRWVAGVFKAFLYAVGALEYQGMWGVVGYDWSNTNVNLAQSWLDTHGSLSYDVQVKMNNTLRYFMTGMGLNSEVTPMKRMHTVTEFP